MPTDQHHPHEVPLFDLVMGQPVPTLSTLAAPVIVDGFACDECDGPTRPRMTDEGPGWHCPWCDRTYV